MSTLLQLDFDAGKRDSDGLTVSQNTDEGILLDAQQALRSRKQELQDVNRTIEALSVTLTALHRQKDYLEEVICMLTHPPISRLPEDVLGEIFIHCVPTHRNPIPVITECPLLLTLVCRKWRAAALSTPRLWTKLHIAFQSSVTPECYDPRRLSDQRWKPRLAGIKQWMSRSGDLPLSLSLKCVILGHIGQESHHIEREAIQAVVEHSRRWEMLELSMTRYSLNTLFSLLDINQSTVPMLRSLRIMEDSPINITHHIGSSHYQLAPEAPFPLHVGFLSPPYKKLTFIFTLTLASYLHRQSFALHPSPVSPFIHPVIAFLSPKYSGSALYWKHVT
ncbi:hypothetical protein CVT24_007678 [Panaeolus cyanescens]|uniref:F-box domain-containing protein n=1 Tax=Panaeolus cyanescens TaxID=181874 RepID=A0A409VRK2_9AGAR|nr:hypothetical protein CVT24_007678 [Panaeolus cyanescens]